MRRLEYNDDTSVYINLWVRTTLKQDTYAHAQTQNMDRVNIFDFRNHRELCDN